jgi:hypothetical protein
MYGLLACMLLGGIAAAAPACSTAPNVAIVASLAPGSPLAGVQGWNLTSYHITPCYDYAVFTNQSGRTFYANGTDAEFGSHAANILSDGGTPPWPWGTIVAPANQTDGQGRRNVFINCGIGTPGLEVVKNRSGGGKLVYGTGEFYVCNSTLPYGPAVALYYREKGGALFEGCADVELLTKCLSDDSRREFQQDSLCL